MDLAVIGTGNVGGTLGKRWADAGHQIFLGARDPQSEKTKAVGATVPRAKVGTPSEAVITSDVILLATPWEVTEPLLTSLDLAGKVVIDCTNALKPDLSGLDLPADLSGGELVQQSRGEVIE